MHCLSPKTQVTLLTHSDPGELLPGDTLRSDFVDSFFVKHSRSTFQHLSDLQQEHAVPKDVS